MCTVLLLSKLSLNHRRSLFSKVINFKKIFLNFPQFLRLDPSKTINWRSTNESGKPVVPLGHPKCGFDYEFCRLSSEVILGLSLISLIILICAWLCIRCVLYSSSKTFCPNSLFSDTINMSKNSRVYYGKWIGKMCVSCLKI